MTAFIKALGTGKSRRAGAYYRNFFTRSNLGDGRLYKAVFKAVFDYCKLILLDGYRVIVESAGARRLTKCGANSARKLGERVSLCKPFKGVFPVTLEYLIIPFGDKVVKRTTRNHTA